MIWMVGVDKMGPELKITSDKSEAETHDVLLLRCDLEMQEVKIGKGTNKGKKLAHRDLLEELMKIGEWKGGERAVRSPEMRSDRFERVAIVHWSGWPNCCRTEVVNRRSDD